MCIFTHQKTEGEIWFKVTFSLVLSLRMDRRGRRSLQGYICLRMVCANTPINPNLAAKYKMSNLLF